MNHNKLVIYTDGGARNNPGPAGIGCLLLDEQGNEVCRISAYIGETTNNQAEYQAVIFALEKAKELKAKELDFFLDSELVVKQLNREYKVKHKDLAPLFLKIHNLSTDFTKIIYRHIPREKNGIADSLVNEAIDKTLAVK